MGEANYRGKALLTATAAASLVLIALGAYTRATNAGMACPDWPLCFGEVVPPFKPGVMQEWVHRVVAGIVMVLFGIAAAKAWANRAAAPRSWKLFAALGVLLLLQALMGALTVWLNVNALVVTGHLLLGTVFFQALLLIAVEAGEASNVEIAAPDKGWSALLLALTVLLLLQLLLGGLVASSGASLACPDFPLCMGSLFPRGGGGYQHLQMTHRLLGFIIFFALALLYFRARSAAGSAAARRYMEIGGGVVLQILIGWALVAFRVPPLLSVLHLCLAQALLFAALLLWRNSSGTRLLRETGGVAGPIRAASPAAGIS